MQSIDHQTQRDRGFKERENGGNQLRERKNERKGGKRMDAKGRLNSNYYQKRREIKGKRENQLESRNI